MDLFCPHCTRRVTVPDDQAGQVLSCPLCTKQFMAPSLAPTAAAPKPTPPAPVSTPKPEETYGMGPAPVPPPTQPPSAPTPAPGIAEPTPAAPPTPPPPPGAYTQSFLFQLCDKWLAFVTPACWLLIFFLSFFTWHSTENTTAANMWSLAFVPQMGHITAYMVLFCLAFPLVFVTLGFDKGWIPAPPQLAVIVLIKNLVVGAFLAFAFVLLAYDFVNGNLFEKSNPIALPMKLAFRLHFIAVLASFLMFWLQWRKKYNLPLPKCEVRW
jgi:hypothetical protein